MKYVFERKEKYIKLLKTIMIILTVYFCLNIYYTLSFYTHTHIYRYIIVKEQKLYIQVKYIRLIYSSITNKNSS